MTNAVRLGNPDAVNPHGRFDELEVASEKPRRRSIRCKRLLTTIVACGAMFAAMPLMAAKEKVGGYTWTYKIIDGTAEISGVSPALAGDIEIPSTLVGYTVTSFFEGAFSGCSELTSVKIPNGVTCIGGLAFQNCSSLASVALPPGLKSIRYISFEGCSSLTSVTIPASVTTIENDVFHGCTAMSDVYCHPDPAALTWIEGRSDFMSGKKTKVHVPAARLSAYKSKFGNKIRATFVGDLDSIFTVTFNANGGEVAELERTVKKDYAVGTLPKATKKGYTLKGWYTAKSGGSQITTKTKVTKNVTYYAQWKANKYIIKFNKNGGTGTMEKQSATYGKTVTLRANAFKKRGYKFAGWAKTKDGKVAYKNKAKVKNLTTVNGRTVTLYAVWNKKASNVESAAKSAKAVSAAATVPAWAAGVFYGGDGESLTAITVSASGEVSGKVFFASETWTIEGTTDGQRIEAVMTDAAGGSTAISLVITELDDGRCRIESEDGLTWAEKGL